MGQAAQSDTPLTFASFVFEAFLIKQYELDLNPSEFIENEYFCKEKPPDSRLDLPAM